MKNFGLKKKVKKIKKKYRAGLAVSPHGTYEIYGSAVEDDDDIFEKLIEQCKYSTNYPVEDMYIVTFVLLSEDE